MKKIQIFVAVYLIATVVKSQPYGHTTYTHSGSTYLSSGTITSNSPGFVMTGSPFVMANFNFHFCIDKVDVDGNFNNIGTTDFYTEYMIISETAPGCNGNTALYGNKSPWVTLIETTNNIMSNCNYAVVGSIDHGCFFSLLDNQGVPITGKTFYYPYPANATGYYKAHVVQESGTSAGTGNFYITGIFQQPGFLWTMFVMKIDVNGNVLWSHLDNTGSSNASIRPFRIIESPYAGSPEVAIVGTTYDGSSTNEEGFLMLVDGNTGAINAFHTYGSGGSANDGFFTIALANNPGSSGQPGFVIGGNTNMYVGSANPGRAWMLLVDGTGTIIDWSSVITTQSDPNAGGVYDVLERTNSSGQYEYYGSIGSLAGIGMMLCKLDNVGAKFPGNNEFVYSMPGAATGMRITFLDNGSGSNIGLHIYGGPSNITTHYLVLACFNGVAGCSDYEYIDTLQYINPGPSNIQLNAPINTFGSMSLCNNISLTVTSVPNTPTQCGPFANIPTGGSNAREITGISEKQNISFGVNLFPNPATHKALVSFHAEANDEARVNLYNAMGQFLHSIEPVAIQPGRETERSAEIDFDALDVAEGIYMVDVLVNGTSHKQKIIYSRE